MDTWRPSFKQGICTFQGECLHHCPVSFMCNLNPHYHYVGLYMQRLKNNEDLYTFTTGSASRVSVNTREKMNNVDYVSLCNLYS